MKIVWHGWTACPKYIKAQYNFDDGYINSVYRKIWKTKRHAESIWGKGHVVKATLTVEIHNHQRSEKER